MKVAVQGLRHAHIAAIIKKIQNHPELEIVAVSESQPELCAGIIGKAGVRVTHHSFEKMLAEVDFDILAVGDVYARRGPALIKALQAGKHIISDKPYCTTPEEHREITRLVKDGKRTLLTHLTLRYKPDLLAARQVLREGLLGEIITVSVTGRHPLDYRNGREEWYFEPELHGGTLNDLGIHGLDAVEWLTGTRIQQVLCARAWNQSFPEAPFFQNAAQAMLKMDNGAGMLLDVSYTAVKNHKEGWPMMIYGTKGALLLDRDGGELCIAGEPKRNLESPANAGRNIIDDLVDEIHRKGADNILNTDDSLRAGYLAVMTQQAAEQGTTPTLP